MNEVVLNIIKDTPLTIPKILLKNYKKLGLTEEELLVLISLINKGEKSVYDPNIFTEELDMDKYTAMQILNDLADKKIITIKLETNRYGKKEEYIYTDLLYKKLMQILIGDNNVFEETPKKDIYFKFENELGRTISPTEIELISDWLRDGITEEIIEEALKEAVFNNVRNFRYIDKIIYNWHAKGIKTKNDIIKEKKKYYKKIMQIENNANVVYNLISKTKMLESDYYNKMIKTSIK